jgi:hypothetical protein
MQLPNQTPCLAANTWQYKHSRPLKYYRALMQSGTPRKWNSVRKLRAQLATRLKICDTWHRCRDYQRKIDRILNIFTVKINKVARVQFSPCVRETLRVSFMLHVAPSIRGCAHASNRVKSETPRSFSGNVNQPPGGWTAETKSLSVHRNPERLTEKTNLQSRPCY